ncbi:MAG: hypothetical protein DRJ30_05715 [Candidatus Methanomethylicota archaeon]|nr:MAG: hypothetical protein DRJ30_05715 [Candidatus Verstraetearchaeota archaeon]
MKYSKFKPSSKNLTLMALLSALYASLTLIPISPFIGGPSLLSLNLIIIPVLAYFLNPLEAFISSIIGGLASMWLPSALSGVFGPFAILLPICGSTLGSLYKYGVGRIIVAFYLFICIIGYLARVPQFPYWILPHSIALLLCIFSMLKELKRRLSFFLNAYIATMCEQSIMMILASYLLSLPAEIFAIAFPLMIYERLAATIGGFILISIFKGIMKLQLS